MRQRVPTCARCQLKLFQELVIQDGAGHVASQIVICWAEAVLGGAAARRGDVADDAGPGELAEDAGPEAAEGPQAFTGGAALLRAASWREREREYHHPHTSTAASHSYHQITVTDAQCKASRARCKDTNHQLPHNFAP